MPYPQCGVVGYLFLIAVAISYLTPTVLAQDQAPPADADCRSWETLNVDDVKFFRTQKEIDEMLSCSMINRPIVLLPAPGETSFTFTNVQRFYASLTVKNASEINSLDAPKLFYADDAFELLDLPNLETLQIPELRYVGSINFRNLPKLRSVLSMSTIRVSNSNPAWNPQERIRISNTGLEEIDFLETDGDPDTLSNTSIVITANPALTKVDIKGLVAGYIGVNITNNELTNGTAISFPDARRLGDVNITSARTLDVPQLNGIRGSLSIRDNMMTGLDLPALAGITGDFFVVNNTKLSSLKFDYLSRVGNDKPPNRHGSFIISDNTRLDSLSLPAHNYLKVGGGIIIQGNMTRIRATGDTLPFDQDSYLSIVSSDPNFNCDELNKIAGRQWYEDHKEPLPISVYSCTSGNSAPAPVPNQERNTLSKEIAAVLVAVCVIGALLGGVIVFRTRRHRRLRDRALAERVQAIQQEYEWIELESGERIRRRRSRDHGVYRRSEDGVDRPPVYERVGKPGEVPPQYLEVMNSNTTDDGPGGTPTVSAADVDPIMTLQRPAAAVIRPSRLSSSDIPSPTTNTTQSRAQQTDPLQTEIEQPGSTHTEPTQDTNSTTQPSTERSPDCER